MTDRRDRETERLVEELTTTLEALRAELDESRRRRRPPTPSDLLRFTREYTIPTVVATLEATIAALDLLGEVLRFVETGRSARDRAGDASEHLDVDRAGESAVAGAERALSELRRVLADADLPDEPTSRALIEDARALSQEIEARIRESREASSVESGSDRSGTASAASDRGIRIEVSDDRPDDGTATDAAGGRSEVGDGITGDDAADAGVDVDAELESLREEVERREAGEDPEGQDAREAREDREGADDRAARDGPAGEEERDERDDPEGRNGDE